MGSSQGDKLFLASTVEAYPPFIVAAQKVRIALSRRNTNCVIYSTGLIAVHAASLPEGKKIRGRIAVKSAAGSASSVKITSGRRSREVLLPCTLFSVDPYNFLEIDDASYRGALLFTASKNGKFAVVNYLDVEEYLRGVVPLEMGRRPLREIEALKAQAVAARTYTYHRMARRSNAPFDMVATVADQVYGGAGVENREADMAVKQTAGLVLVSGDSLALAYYHSTCGGRTADVYDVWKKPPQPYLQSVADLDSMQNPYCNISTYATWYEKWSRRDFSRIVIGELRKTYPKERFAGDVIDFSIQEWFPCGRVKRCTITGRGWKKVVGGDKIRFILRRATKGNPILRSASFSIKTPLGLTIELTGQGYGHGVGMCQMGAVGRARDGQNFQTILAAYYSGITIAKTTL